MPLLEGSRQNPPPGTGPKPPDSPPRTSFKRRASEAYSDLARAAIMTSASSTAYDSESLNHAAYHTSLMPPPKTAFGRSVTPSTSNKSLPQPANALGRALTDTPAPSAPNSPQM